MPPSGSRHKGASHLSYVHSSMVTVCVGTEKTKFRVHKELICNKSTFFDKALNGPFVEAKSLTVRLEHISVPLFSIFVSWAYGGRLVYVLPSEGNTTAVEDFFPLLCQTPASLEVDQDDASTWPLDIVAKLYILGDYLDSQQFKNNVISAIDGPFTWNRGLDDADVPTNALIKFVYENTPSKSPLRDLMVDLMVYGQTWGQPTETWEDLPPEFMAKVMGFLGRRLPWKQCSGCYSRAIARNNLSDANADGMHLTDDRAPFADSECFYHEHETKEERDECRQEG
ncbi:hypothetical protein KCU71_g19137, partial [Aureobasidium melanogenum]